MKSNVVFRGAKRGGDLYKRLENGKAQLITLPKRPAVADDASIHRPGEARAGLGPTTASPFLASMETIWQQLADGVIVIDRVGRISMTNAAARQLAQVDPQGMPLELTPLIWGKLLDLEGHEIPAANWPCAKAMHGESTTQQECRLVQANGCSYDILFSAVPIAVVNGKPVGAVATLTDVSQYNKRAQVLRQEAVSRERRRMAEDIHDVLCQRLNAIMLQLQTVQDCFLESWDSALPRLRLAWELARSSLTEARRTMWTFCHESLGGVDPARRVSEVAKEMMQRTSISLHLSLQQQPWELPPRLPLEILRISQEALTNVVKHSQATRVCVELAYKKRALHFSVQDDGRGFVCTAADRQQRGFGLISMRERAERLGGRLSIDSHPGRGTRVAAVIPLTVAAA